jgi:nicotinate-nucleotide adenylyltransferase
VGNSTDSGRAEMQGQVIEDVNELFTLAHFVGVTRPGHRLTAHGLPRDRVSVVEIPALAISATDCRQRVVSGEPIWYLVPDGIVPYIANRRLYRHSD